MVSVGVICSLCMLLTLVVYCLILMFNLGYYDTNSNKRKSDVSGRILITKTNACVQWYLVCHSNRRVALASMNMSVFKSIFLMKPLITLFLRLCNPPPVLNS